MSMPHDLSGPEALQAWARAELGADSARILEGPAGERALARVRQGVSIEDAVLKEVHASIRSHPSVASEFAAYVIEDMVPLGKASMSSSSKLRRFLETDDLINSVLKDMWHDVADLTFETARQFKALFAQRMNWKAIDQARRLNNQTRAEDKRVPEQPEELDHPSQSEDATSQAIRREERDQLYVILTRLSARDQRLIQLRVSGADRAAIAREMGMTYEATCKALQRATAKLRELIEADEADSGSVAPP